MTNLSRRSFVAALAATVPAAAQHTPARRLTAPIPSGPLNPDTLLALGQAILPSELGPDGTTRVVGAFQVWLNEYAGETELVHGYGTGEIEYTPPNPTDRWNRQLDELERIAERNARMRFSDLGDAQRRQIVVGILNNSDTDRLPSPSRAEHVALGLLAYFYATPEATDLCYRVRIAKETCRPLDDATKRPPSRAAGATRRDA